MKVLYCLMRHQLCQKGSAKMDFILAHCHPSAGGAKGYYFKLLLGDFPFKYLLSLR